VPDVLSSSLSHLGQGLLTKELDVSPSAGISHRGDGGPEQRQLEPTGALAEAAQSNPDWWRCDVRVNRDVRERLRTLRCPLKPVALLEGAANNLKDSPENTDPPALSRSEIAGRTR
jgi:hypothetical protein